VIAKLLEVLGLRRLPPPADPVFRFKKFYSFETPYWEAEAEFEPVGRVVEVLVECPRSGASSAQHEFFAELARRYAEVLSAAHRTLAAEAERADTAAAVPSVRSLRLVCISLPEAPPDAEWELSFEDREGVHYTVAFTGWVPARAEITPC
jgi:hypothetical protein